ncbi:MAG: DUF1700 domain-containing protein [Anaerolineaceae bacterium]|nr:DUF1700 domain-containing protein [Anaerolineaceae bacterium]
MMKKDEYLNLFEKSLRKYKVNDLEDILDEYKQHFSFKLLDGYSEEEVASKLGDPEKVALNFALDYEGRKLLALKPAGKRLAK